MKSIVIRNIDDFEKITNDVNEIEFVEYNGIFYFEEDCILSSITFTKMYAELSIIPKCINKLCLFDCDVNFDELKNFTSLKHLEITNRKIDVSELLCVSSIEKLSLNYCEIENINVLKEFSSLKELSLVDTNIDEYDFLIELNSLEKVIISDDLYEENKEFFDELYKKGIIICNMMGGSLNEV